MKWYNIINIVKSFVIVDPGAAEGDGGETATTEDQG